MVAGIEDIYIGETICDNEATKAMPAIEIDEPTISLNFLVNDSPFAGKEGKFVTNRQIEERLRKELEINVGLKIDFSRKDYYKVFRRGELHIAVLLENMRREGYEVQVSKPEVIVKEVEGQKVEPFEELIINVPSDMSGGVIERLGKRKGELKEMKEVFGRTKLLFEAPTRAILGYRNQFIVDTKGEGMLSSRMIGFKKYIGDIKVKATGSMISNEIGKVLAYG
jgi:GTP-binding protein